MRRSHIQVLYGKLIQIDIVHYCEYEYIWMKDGISNVNGSPVRNIRMRDQKKRGAHKSNCWRCEIVSSLLCVNMLEGCVVVH